MVGSLNIGCTVLPNFLLTGGIVQVYFFLDIAV